MSPDTPINTPPAPLRARVMKALAWRSASQIAAQIVTWSATFLVIRLLTPGDYGVFAATQSVTILLAMLSGDGIASALIRDEQFDRGRAAQMFGLLIVINAALAILQCAIAPLAADYYRQPAVADLLRIQSLAYLANPFIALGGAMLAHALDFRRLALANIVSAVAGAATALLCALAGLGIYALVAAPLALYAVRAIALTVAAPLWIAPSFRLAGAWTSARFGTALMVSQIFWFVQTQSDVVIGGRTLAPSELGLYTTALFLAQILTAKFVPPLNEVAFAGYARMRGDPAAVAAAFLRSVEMIMLVAMPFSIGMALTAGPLVALALGDHWTGAAPIVRLLAMAMPFVTLQILFSPVTNALGRPMHAVYGAVAGAVIMPAAFLIGAPYGVIGLALAWLAAFPILCLFTAAISLPVIGIGFADIGRAIRPALAASAFMAIVVLLAGRIGPIAASRFVLPLSVAIGVLAYGGWLALTRPRLVAALLRRGAPA